MKAAGTLTNISLDIHHHLWWTGRPENIHSISDQKIRRREIIVTERIRLHMIVDEVSVFIKPLPAHLLDYTFWKDHISPSPLLSKQALGFLFSYIGLITHPCDLKMAKDLGLTPSNLKWDQWRIISSSTLRHLEKYQTHNRFLMTPRYKFGELRLNRLNHVMIFCRRNFMRMYYRQHSTYNQYFSRNFAWMLLVVVYLGVILGAMQVISGTSENHYTKVWNDANYWFSALSIWLIVGVTCMQLLIFAVLFWVYFIQTIYKNKKEGIPVIFRSKEKVNDEENAQ